MTPEALSPYPRRIALVDCNNFYASCERVFQPAWNKRPIGVLSNNDGCIVARSNELKAAGIPMGAPYFKYKDKLKAMGAIIVSSNYALYGDMSARVMSTLAGFAPSIEIYSIDEAWLDFTSIPLESLDAVARNTVARTHKETGIPVSMGIAPTKVLAKIANRICKKRQVPGGVFNMGSADHIDEILRGFEVGDIWGVGRRLKKRLNSQGIYSALELKNTDPELMRKRYSIVMQRLILELQGVHCLGLEEFAPKKQIIASRSFGQRVTELAELSEAVSSHVARAAEKLRSQHSVCGGLSVFIRTSMFNRSEPRLSQYRQVRFLVATANTQRLIGAALGALEQIYRKGYRYAKAGIMLFDISQASSVQMSLFESPDTAQNRKLMKAMDSLNQQHGRKTLFVASMGTNKKKGNWQMKREQKTRSYTTNWAELLTVK